MVRTALSETTVSSEPECSRPGQCTVTTIPNEQVEASAQQMPVPGMTTPSTPNTCFYVPGSIAGQKVLLLLDTGCTTSVLGKHVFQRLPQRVRGQLRTACSSGILADGSPLLMHGRVSVSGKLHSTPFTEDFLVGEITDDAILGMSFFRNYSSCISFNQPSLMMEGRSLACTDRQGKLLSARVQLADNVTIPARTEQNITVRLLDEVTHPVGLIEGKPDSLGGLLVAASVNQLESESCTTVVHCCNVTEGPLQLRAGKVVGYFRALEAEDIRDPSEGEQLHSVEERVRPTTVVQVPSHVKDLYEKALSVCGTEEHAVRVAKLLNRFSDVFSCGEDDVGLTNLVTHSIPPAASSAPIKQPPHRLGPEKEAEVERQVEGLLKRGMIEPGSGSWASPVVLVRKKDNSWRFCVHYRRINDITIRDAYPLPRIDDTLDALAGSQYFSTLDLLSGYWQVPLDPEAQEKAAFVTRSGLWNWKVLPFGLTSAPATFERLMEMVLRGLHWKTLLIYLDDVIVFSHSLEDHCARLAEVFSRLRTARLKLKPSKCELFQTKVNYLGHVVSSRGVSTDPQKVKAVQEWPKPQCLTQLKAFLGTVGYYRRYIPDYATVAKPLNQLTSKKFSQEWNEQCDAAFHTLKDSLTSAPILGYPDPTLPYLLDTDASKWAVGAVLSQVQEGRERVIAYYSKTLSDSERNYCTTRKELLAVIKAIKHFRPYLYGRKFTLRTDHASLKWLCRRSQPSDQVARWLEALAEMDYEVEHRAGSKHGNADGLSRNGCVDCKQCQRIEKRDGGATRKEVEESVLLESTPKPEGEVPVASEELRTVMSRSTADVVALQQTGELAKIYGVVKGTATLTPEELQTSSWELQKLHKMRDSLRIDRMVCYRLRSL